MSRRAALPAPLSPRSRCSRRSICTGPTPHIMARIVRTDSRLPASAPRVCTHHHAACARAGPATRLRLLASTCSSGERLSGGDQVVHEPGGACARLCPATAHVSVAGSALPRVLAAAPPRLAPELAQPTPDSPMRAPKDLPRAILAYGHGSGRESGMLSHICVAYLAISRPGPPLLHASIAPYISS